MKAIWQELPDESYIYIADQAHVPYGSRPLEQVRTFAVGITRFLLKQEAKIIVVACNAASAAALHHLRGQFPSVLFVGMEPAVKPAVEQTHSGAVGVLATPATFQGELYASVVERFAAGVQLIQNTCPGLVDQIEAGRLQSTESREILERAILPMRESGIDTIVLGCTHYPFVIPLIEQIAGAGVRVIDPAPAVARQVRRLLAQSGSLAPPQPRTPKNFQNVDVYDSLGICATRFYTSGNPQAFGESLSMFVDMQKPVESVFWNEQQDQLSQER